MHVSEVNRTRREITQLVKGEMDMRLVVDAAELLASDASVPSVRVLEAGMIATYCRAFTLDRKRRRPVTLQYLTDDETELALHARLFELRDTVYAHSDETSARVGVDPFGGHSYAEGYRPDTGAAPSAIAALARHHETLFRDALTEREDALRAAGVPTDATL